MEIQKEMELAGVKYDYHQSDLYVPINKITIDIVERYQFKNNVESFKSNIDGTMWFDIPFAYNPIQ